jgi:hypothetical protein
MVLLDEGQDKWFCLTRVRNKWFCLMRVRINGSA